jgi:hypothetical protein
VATTGYPPDGVTTPDPEDAPPSGAAPVNADGDPRPVRPRQRYSGAVKAAVACTGTGYLTAMPLSGAGRLATWPAVTAVLLGCCAVVAVRGARPLEEEQKETGTHVHKR